MKNFDSRTYSISDFLEWNRNKQLELSPRFQRRSVWNENGRSYLMDTIVRGLPIPKVFIRQKINVTTRDSVREVVDGQQRIRTILSFINDGFMISKRHNEQYGGYYFSQLGQIDPDIQASILNYEISVDLLVNMSDPSVLDVFSRLNSYSIVLNEQEKINANHFGPFKNLADELSKELYDFWLDSRILTEQKILRMDDVNLTADLLIAMLDGIREKKKIKTYYDKFESDFPFDDRLYAERFMNVVYVISCMFPSGLRNTMFSRIHIFYSLFTALYHIMYGLPNIDIQSSLCTDFNEGKINQMTNKLNRVDEIFEMFLDQRGDELSQEDKDFIDYSRRATTDKSKREFRTKYIVRLLLQ